MRIESDYVVFDSGKKMWANCGIIGISFNENGFNLTEGYDGGFCFGEWENKLSSQEKNELADYMIELWKKFKKEIK